MNHESDYSENPAAELVEREPGDVVLWAEPIGDESAARSVSDLQYNRQAPRADETFPYGVNWVRVLVLLALVVVIVIVLVGGPL